MNGVHDMGGMDGFGPMLFKKDEPVFHEDWEKRMYGIAMTIAAQKFRNIDEFRHAIERIPAPTYLDSSYYERWLNALMTLLVEKQFVTRKELIAADASIARAGANLFRGALCGQAPSSKPPRARFARAIASSRATSIRPDIPVSRATCAESAASSIAIGALMFSRTAMRIMRGSSRSTSIQ